VLRLTRLDGTTETHEVPGPEFTLAYGIQRFVNLCRDGGGAGADHARTLGALRVLESIRASAAGDGSWFGSRPMNNGDGSDGSA
jgi:hypothetical protein